MTWASVAARLQLLFWPAWIEAWWVHRERLAATALSSRTAATPRRLFVDVSVITRHDAGTGIQRVVRALASELVAQGLDGWEIQTVAATGTQAYRQVSWRGENAMLPQEVSVRPGDVFLGLDFALDTICRHRRQLAKWKHEGGLLWFLMYDLLPVQRPDWFSGKLVVRYRRWLRVLAALADGFFCISPPVEAALRDVLARRYLVSDEPKTKVLPMAGDLSAGEHTRGLPADFQALMSKLAERQTALMVGTLEPRKGHADALAAFELLWQQGTDANLVIVGRPGWHTEAFQAVLRGHPLRGKRLFWLPDASDEALEQLYQICDGVIAASFAEGFGLPIIEALAYGKAVFARDIPVFRLHEKQNVEYFPEAADPPAIAKLLSAWLASSREKAEPVCGAVTRWSDTARYILTTLSLESV